MKNIVIILIVGAVAGFVSSEVAFRRNVGRLDLIEPRLGAIDRSLARLGEQRAQMETSIDILNKIAELQARVPEQNARLRSGFVSQVEFAALRTNTQESLQAVREALDLHDEQIEELYETLRDTEATVALHADKIAELEKP